MAEAWISEHANRFAKELSVDFAIELKSENILVGNISLMMSKAHCKAEIGYWIGEEFWNKGYCTEAMREVVRYAFEVRGLNKITCRHVMTNPASGKVMLKSGLTQEGYLKQEIIKNGRFYDMLVYGLLKAEYKERPSDNS